MTARPQSSKGKPGSDQPLSPKERADLEQRYHDLQREVLQGELRLIERKRRALVEAGIFDPDLVPPPPAKKPRKGRRPHALG